MVSIVVAHPVVVAHPSVAPHVFVSPHISVPPAEGVTVSHITPVEGSRNAPEPFSGGVPPYHAFATITPHNASGAAAGPSDLSDSALLVFLILVGLVIAAIFLFLGKD